MELWWDFIYYVPESLKTFFKISSAYDHVSLSVPKKNFNPPIIDTRRSFRFNLYPKLYPKHREPLLKWTRNYNPNLCSGTSSTFSLELLNTTFHNSFTVANDVKLSSRTVRLPPLLVTVALSRRWILGELHLSFHVGRTRMWFLIVSK